MSEHAYYRTLQELEAAESNGYVTVKVYQKTSRTGFVRTLTSVVGMYDTKKDAQNAAAALRAKHRRNKRNDPLRYESVKLLAVNVEAVWKP